MPHRIEAVDNLVVIKFEFWSAYAMVGIMFQVKFTEWSQHPDLGGSDPLLEHKAVKLYLAAGYSTAEFLMA